MDNQKIDPSLQLTLDIPAADRHESSLLDYGFDKATASWQIIVKYFGGIKHLETEFPGTIVIELLNGYGLITTYEENIAQIAMLPEIEYIEKPKRLYFNLQNGRADSCLSGVQKNLPSLPESNLYGYQLSGSGTLIGIIDSGIDFSHPGFIAENGESRIAYLWNQAVTGEESIRRAPAGYRFGAQYTKEELTDALSHNFSLPETETGSGHGTAVAGIAAGNGSGSAGRRYRGVATESELIIVKLGRKEEDFSGTTEVMAGIDYAIRKAISLNKPIAINLSFGTNRGPHDGKSLFENYIADLNVTWKNVIVAASGNEGDARHHAQAVLGNSPISVEFTIGTREKNITLQIWKHFVDSFRLILSSPSGKRFYLSDIPGTANRFETDTGEILYYFGSPTPFSTNQEILFEWISTPQSFIESGIWSVTFYPEEIKTGIVDLWLPTVEAIGTNTGFLLPEPDTTLTLPSTARNVITVGAYQTATDTVAPFSGRGNTADGREKPTLVAPGVDIITTIPGGGYGAKTGTSIAAPFVTGSASLLMEWGIVKGNDPYLYGEKLKAYLMKGARRLTGQSSVPDNLAGYGALCVRNSFPANQVL